MGIPQGSGSSCVMLKGYPAAAGVVKFCVVEQRSGTARREADFQPQLRHSGITTTCSLANRNSGDAFLRHRGIGTPAQRRTTARKASGRDGKDLRPVPPDRDARPVGRKLQNHQNSMAGPPLVPDTGSRHSNHKHEVGITPEKGRTLKRYVLQQDLGKP